MDLDRPGLGTRSIELHPGLRHFLEPRGLEPKPAAGMESDRQSKSIWTDRQIQETSQGISGIE